MAEDKKSEKKKTKPKEPKKVERKPTKFARDVHISNAKAMHGVSKGMVAGAIAVINENKNKEKFTKSEVADAIKRYARLTNS